MATLKPVRTEQDCKTALAEIELLIDAEAGSEDGDRREVLTILVDHYLQNHDAGAGLDVIDALKAYMEKQSLSVDDLCRVIDTEPHEAAALLDRHRVLRVADIRRLHAQWRLPLEVLVLPYGADPVSGKTEIVMKPRWPSQRSSADLGRPKKSGR